ncbi:hypothetical protein CLF_110913 [Clonorchis sinensis]|uniref:C2H2-type domain-containing protein n=1 Tax=Clonorchis sinensis TaxID=79923 RepID=G7YU19_CLOSI|nr:hypothetical protein CLF_110913 [Clonorchis sinensis]
MISQYSNKPMRLFVHFSVYKTCYPYKNFKVSEWPVSSPSRNPIADLWGKMYAGRSGVNLGRSVSQIVCKSIQVNRLKVTTCFLTVLPKSTFLCKAKQDLARYQQAWTSMAMHCQVFRSAPRIYCGLCSHLPTFRLDVGYHKLNECYNKVCRGIRLPDDHMTVRPAETLYFYPSSIEEVDRTAAQIEVKNEIRGSGYPTSLIKRHLRRVLVPVAEPNRDWIGTAVIPYKPGTWEVIRRILNKANIKVAFQKGNTLCFALVQLKDRFPASRDCVYTTKCNDCTKVYIGQTARGLHNRIGEHRRKISRPLKNANEYQAFLKDSATAKHALDTGHKIELENVEFLRQGLRSKLPRLMAETVEIGKHPSVNRMEDVKLASACMSNNKADIVEIIGETDHLAEVENEWRAFAFEENVGSSVSVDGRRQVENIGMYGLVWVVGDLVTEEDALSLDVFQRCCFTWWQFDVHPEKEYHTRQTGTRFIRCGNYITCWIGPVDNKDFPVLGLIKLIERTQKRRRPQELLAFGFALLPKGQLDHHHRTVLQLFYSQKEGECKFRCPFRKGSSTDKTRHKAREFRCADECFWAIPNCIITDGYYAAWDQCNICIFDDEV